MNYLEEKILYIDIGVKFIKTIFVKKNWQNVKNIVFSYKKPTLGINIYGIESFQEFNQSINQIIYEVEYEISSKIDNVVIIYSFFATNFIKNNYTIQLYNKEITEGDCKKLKIPPLLDLKYKVLHENYYFILDHYLYSMNPVGMICKYLSISQKYLLIHNVLYNNINNIFVNNSINVLNHFSCLYILSEYIKKYHSSFLIIDGGYYNTRIIFIENNILKDFIVINIGIFHLLKNISLKYKLSMDDSYTLSFNEGLLQGKIEEVMKINQLFLNNVFEKSLSNIKNSSINSLDIPIFISGWSFLTPIEYYLKYKYNRDFFVISSYFNWPENMEYLYALYSL
jgi:cell division ATPase FtsA